MACLCFTVDLFLTFKNHIDHCSPLHISIFKAIKPSQTIRQLPDRQTSFTKFQMYEYFPRLNYGGGKKLFEIIINRQCKTEISLIFSICC